MKQRLHILSFAVALGLFHAVFFLSPWGESLERRFLDLWFNLRGPIPPPENIVIVAMDEESYPNLGIDPAKPWPRSTHAKLLQRLARAGAREVVFDIVFEGAGSDPAGDQELAEAIGLVPTVLGADLSSIEEGTHRRETLIMPARPFAARAQSVGLVVLPEESGYIRRFLTERTEATRGMPSLEEAAASRKSGELGLPGRRDFINYYGPRRTIPTFSYYQALDSEHPLPAEVFRDKIVFVGFCLRMEAGPAQKDTSLTPFARHGRTFGVEIHATAAANLLTNDWLRRAPQWLETLLLSILAAALGAALCLLRPQWGAVLLGGHALGWMGIASAAFLARRFIPGAVLAVTLLPAGYLATTLYYYVVTRRQERQLERAFQFYLSPQMAREVARNPKALRLGGEETVATALFTDIEGFTSTAESMPPDEVARMLNAYFTEVMNAIFDKQGTLIKFIGDAVFALWGAPIKTPDHARLACEAALSIEHEIARFNASGRFPRLRTRIGIHTGAMVVGNLGSTRRFDFTAIGDSVNLASRVEGLNKYFGTEILITDSVRTEVGNALASLKLGAIRVVGKKKAVGLHTLLAEPLSAETKRLWTEALGEFIGRRWDSAASLFEDVAHAERRLQKAAALYRSQIEQHRRTPPGEDWQGEIVFSAK